MSYGGSFGRDLPLLGHVKATFHTPAREGDSVRYSVRAVKMTSTMGLFEGIAEVEGREIARAELALGISSPAAGEGTER